MVLGPSPTPVVRTLPKVPANEAYRIEAMPVPAVLVTLKGGEGGLLIEEDTGKEVRITALYNGSGARATVQTTRIYQLY